MEAVNDPNPGKLTFQVPKLGGWMEAEPPSHDPQET